MEIIGVIFLVIILVAGIVFYLSFSTNSDSNKSNAFNEDQNLATQFVLSLGKFDVDCDGNMISFDDLVKGCDATSIPGMCADPCTAVEDSIDIILDETFIKWNKNFIFNIDYPTNAPKNLERSSPECRRSSSVFAGQEVPIDLAGTSAIISLRVCV